MKPIIIGEAPGKNGDASRPCEGRVGARLAAAAGITIDEYLEMFDRVNLLDEQPQDAPKGMAFNVKKAGKVARYLEHNKCGLYERPLALLLGKRVAAAFRLINVVYFVPISINGTKTYVVPHPSGVNRWWNELDNELQMVAFMRDVVRQLRG